MNSVEPAVLSNISNVMEEWVDQYTDSMVSWASHKTGRKDVAEDLVQDVFIAAYQSYNNFKGDSSPKTWLFSILNRKIADHFREQYKGSKPDDGSLNTVFSMMFKADGHWTQCALMILVDNSPV
jgi:RNA polymerase sigma factor (sigma-70 family)